MSHSKSNKIKLLQSASALILGATAVTAHAQTVSTTSTDVTLATSVDGLIVVDQSVSTASGKTATANDANFTAGDGVAATNSSVAITSSSTVASAINNTATQTVTDSGAAATDKTSGISVEQDNASSSTAQIGSATDGTDVKLTTGATEGSSLAVSGTVNRASATGNTAATSVSTTDFTTNSTQATLGAMQQNTGVTGEATNIAITATVKDTEINVTAGATTSSALTLGGNTDSAVATANSLTQRMTLTGTNLTLGTGSATAETDADTSAAGQALLSSRQGNAFTDVSASNTASAITLVAGATNGSSLDVMGNMQDSNATGSTAGNILALSGTNVGTGAAIVSTQTSDSESTVTAATTGQAGITAASLGATTGSSASLTDNMLQSRATGGTVTNTLTAAATTMTLKSPDTTNAAELTSLAGAVSGGFATLNDQSIAGDVTATTTTAGAADAGFTVSVTGNVSNGSSINNDRNMLTAQAQGAAAANTTTLAIGGTLSQGTTVAGAVANAAVIANIQELSDGADVTASVKTGQATSTVDGKTVTDTDPAILTSVGGTLTSSSVSTSNNRIQAFADGASATNVLTASATTLTTAANTSATDATPPVDTSGVPGSTALTADAAFAVVNRQDGGNGKITAELNDPIPLRTAIVGATSSSSVTSTGNMQDAFATSNKATNSITLAATTLTSDGAVVNNQNSDAQVLSIIGATTAGTAGLTGENAGVIVDFNGAISGSNIAVTGNMVRGSAISNVGTNSLTATATTLTGDGTDAKASADSDSLTTNADFSLGNLQTLDENATSTTKVYATYGVDVAFDQAVTDSKIAVSNNVQFGEALGNSATNKVELTAVGAGVSGNDPTAALNNVQSGLGAIIGATSEMSLYANMASSGSSVALNGNSNTSLGAINNASNTVSVSGLAVDGSTGLASVNVTDDVTTADYALNNNQAASGTLTSTAKTTAYNLDSTDTTTSGILNGSASLSKNTTTAEASANRVANSLAISATDNGATAALGNDQVSSAGVTATASNSSYKLELTTAASSTYAASGSSVAVEGNTTTALARGNSASNALNYNVNVAYTGIATDPTFTGTTVASAGAVVLNAQTNTGAVAANAVSVVYGVGLTGATGSSGSALNSSVSLGNNTTSAVAFGNAATNSLTMATWSAGIPSSAISSNQVNGGAVTATATGVAFNMTPTGPASGSAFRNTGNSVNAQAVGNSSVSTIGGGI